MKYYKSSHPEVFLGKGVLKVCSKFRGEHPCRSAISNFIEIALRQGCSSGNLLHIFRTPFLKKAILGGCFIPNFMLLNAIWGVVCCEYYQKCVFFRLVYLRSFLDLVLFLPYLYDLFFISIFLFIIINRVISRINTCLLFAFSLTFMSHYVDDVDEEWE